MGEENNEKKVIAPIHDTLKVSGELSYGEGHRAWNMIRLKKELLREFPQLKERRNKFSYKMIMDRTYKDLKKRISKMEKESEVLPIFLFFCRE